MRSHPPIRFLTLSLLCLGVLAGWAQEAPVVKHDKLPATEHESSATAVPAPQSKPSQFVLGPADVIRVNVWKSAELSQTVTIGPDGFVTLPLLGDVHVTGMTANQLGLTLASRFSSYVVDPQVTVSVVDIRSRQVYVLGQVGKPG